MNGVLVYRRADVRDRIFVSERVGKMAVVSVVRQALSGATDQWYDGTTTMPAGIYWSDTGQIRVRRFKSVSPSMSQISDEEVAAGIRSERSALLAIGNAINDVEFYPTFRW